MADGHPGQLEYGHQVAAMPHGLILEPARAQHQAVVVGAAVVLRAPRLLAAASVLIVMAGYVGKQLA